MSTGDLHALTGAYALGALSEDEAGAFESHLAVCEVCAQEVRELTATAARLGLAASAIPPPGLKQEVIARISTIRQLPPKVAGEETPAVPVMGRLRRVRRLVLAACLCAVAGLGGVTIWQHDQAQDARQRAEQATQRTQQLAEILTAPDARTASARFGDGATGTVVVSAGQDKASFFATGLPDPPSGRTYQLWFSDDGSMRPAGLMRHDGALVMTGNVGDAKGMGVTLEPAGGSQQPTTQPLLLMALPRA